ncbi:hypothetical protein PO002_34950 [Cupriavidus necator]|uniref:hypothetical protein n=1 Tax=Cupriavidus necator TaxID=106590 RepID=UPI0039C2F98C
MLGRDLAASLRAIRITNGTENWSHAAKGRADAGAGEAEFRKGVSRMRSEPNSASSPLEAA